MVKLEFLKQQFCKQQIHTWRNALLPMPESVDVERLVGGASAADDVDALGGACAPVAWLCTRFCTWKTYDVRSQSRRGYFFQDGTGSRPGEMSEQRQLNLV